MRGGPPPETRAKSIYCAYLPGAPFTGGVRSAVPERTPVLLESWHGVCNAGAARSLICIYNELRCLSGRYIYYRAVL